MVVVGSVGPQKGNHGPAQRSTYLCHPAAMRASKPVLQYSECPRKREQEKIESVCVRVRVRESEGVKGESEVAREWSSEWMSDSRRGGEQ